MEDAPTISDSGRSLNHCLTFFALAGASLGS